MSTSRHFEAYSDEFVHTSSPDFLVAYKFYALAVIAGGLLYTALADIFPEFKGKGGMLQKLLYLLFVVIGIFLFVGFESVTGHDDHAHEGEVHIEGEIHDEGEDH